MRVSIFIFSSKISMSAERTNLIPLTASSLLHVLKKIDQPPSLPDLLSSKTDELSPPI